MVYFMGHIFPYIAVAVFFLGFTCKIRRWLATPSPFPITNFPAPRNLSGRLTVFLQELLLFNSLYSYNKLLWLLSWLMHVTLGLIIIGHIVGIYFLGEQFVLFGMAKSASLALSSKLGLTSGVVFIICLFGLMGRRFYDTEARITSDLSNYLELGLLGGIAVTGLGLRLAATGQELALIREYISGLVWFRQAAIPGSPWFLWHFFLVNILVMYLPYSNLVHWLGGGIIRLMLTEQPPEYPTPAGKPPRSAFAGLAARHRPEQPKSNISMR